jgi:hypothetical protein
MQASIIPPFLYHGRTEDEFPMKIALKSQIAPNSSFSSDEIGAANPNGGWASF